MKVMVKLACTVTCALLLVAAGLASGANRAINLGSLGYAVEVPDTWVQQPPENTMRLAQFQIRGPQGQDPASVVVFFFGKGGGGTVEANVQRWESQFTGQDGKPGKAVQRKAKAAGMPVTWAELNGNYARGMGMGHEIVAKPNQTLLAAIVETPKGNITFHLYGPKASVAGARKGFESMVASLK
ncbi:MAG TPA: hypothetical protein VF104_00255 [Burkholderiales bacterium]